MKRIGCLILFFVLSLSLFTVVSASLGYDDLRPTYINSSDIEFYKNSTFGYGNNDYYYDDHLQLRSNCYGYAIRLHLASVMNSSTYLPYKQVPGEFYSRESTEVTYDEFYDNYNCSTLSVYRGVMKDCSVLGYTITSLCADPSETYIPPTADSQQDKRLIAVVTRPQTDYYDADFHFYIQNSDNTWSNKPGSNEAVSICTEHNIALTNNNISQHIHCNNYSSTALLFYIDGPGTTDRGHLYGQDNAFVTNIRSTDCAGNVIKSAEPLQSISSFSKSGWINHRGDVDYYLFDVTESGTYTIEMLTSDAYTMTYRYGDVTSISSSSVPSLSDPAETTTSDGRVAKNIYLTKGKIYCIMIYSSNQDLHEYDRWYVLNII